MKDSILGFIVIGFFVAIGLIGGGYFIGQTMYNAKVAVNVAEAKGLAERRVKSDRAEWSVRYSVAAGTGYNMKDLYRRAQESQDAIIGKLKQSGFSDGEITIGVINNSYREFRDDQQKLVDEKYILSGTISVETTKVDLVAKARSTVNALIAEGHTIDNNNPSYRFTGLNEIKPDMLSEASKNARVAASQFAADAGVKVGKIQSARQGAFIIRDVGSDYGDTQKLFKDVRVVTTINFYLAD